MVAGPEGPAYNSLVIIALSFVPGARLDRVIRQAELKARSDLMKLSGQWLKAYTDIRTASAPQFSPSWWIKKHYRMMRGYKRAESIKNVVTLTARIGACPTTT